MRFISSVAVVSVIIAACGGATTDIDGGTDATTDTGGGDAKADGNPTDSAINDVVTVDAAECTPPDTACTTPCPPGTYCLRASGPVSHDLGCTTIPASCNGTPSCACMADCFCPQEGVNKCTQSNDALTCDNGAVSRRAFKKDIKYVNDSERAALADEALSMSLARYRYKTESAADKTHLGFIIDDQPDDSAAVASDATHVDLYGYTSMLLATVQEQQKQIDELKNQVQTLRANTK